VLSKALRARRGRCPKSALRKRASSLATWNRLSAWEDYLASNQLAYDPTSPEPLASSLAWNRFTYTGHEFDPETGLY